MPGKQRRRSPAYPSIGLEEAIDRVRQLYEAEGQHPTMLEVAAEKWGYSHRSSGMKVTVAALRYFGLIDSAGTGENRTIRVSDRAVTILLAPEDSRERAEAIRAAAMAPTAYARLLDEYGTDLPSDQSLRLQLVRDWRFNANALPDFLKGFRSTMDFAELGPGDVGHEDRPGAGMPEARRAAASGPPAATPPAKPFSQTSGGERSRQTEWTIPLMGGRFAVLNAPRPLSDGDYKLIEGWLTLMRPALVERTTNDEAGQHPCDGLEELP